MMRLFSIIKFYIDKLLFRSRLTARTLPALSISTRIQIGKDARLVLGKRVVTFDHAAISVVSGKCRIGDYSALNRNCIIVCRDRIEIGNQCRFGPNVCIYDHDPNYDYNGIGEGYKTSPIIIEDGCWIGANVTILRGTYIGEKSVIGAGSVVKGRIPSHSLVINENALSIREIK